MGRGDSSVLVDSPLEMVSRKNTGGCTTLNSLHLYLCTMLSNQTTNNCVNEAGTNNGEDLSHGRFPVEVQRRPGRHQATARTGIRKKWSREENMFVI